MQILLSVSLCFVFSNAATIAHVKGYVTRHEACLPDNGGHTSPYPGDCTMFLECNSNLKVILLKDCGPESYYNPNMGNLHYCEWKEARPDYCTPQVQHRSASELIDEPLEDVVYTPLEEVVDLSLEVSANQPLEGVPVAPSDNVIDAPLEAASNALFDGETDATLEGATDTSLEGESDAPLEGETEASDKDDITRHGVCRPEDGGATSPYAEDCTKFQQCNGDLGLIIIRDCLPKSYYNPRIGSGHYCEWMETRPDYCN